MLMITKKYIFTIPTAGAVAATNNNNAVTGIAAGGGHYGAVRLMAADGTLTAAAAGDMAVPIDTKASKQNTYMTAAYICEGVFTGNGAALNKPYLIDIPQTNLHVPAGMALDGAQGLCRFNSVTQDFWDLTPDFGIKYTNATKMLRISFGGDVGATVASYITPVGGANLGIRFVLYFRAVGN